MADQEAVEVQGPAACDLCSTGSCSTTPSRQPFKLELRAGNPKAQIRSPEPSAIQPQTLSPSPVFSRPATAPGTGFGQGLEQRHMAIAGRARVVQPCERLRLQLGNPPAIIEPLKRPPQGACLGFHAHQVQRVWGVRSLVLLWALFATNASELDCEP